MTTPIRSLKWVTFEPQSTKKEQGTSKPDPVKPFPVEPKIKPEAHNPLAPTKAFMNEFYGK